MTDEDGSFEIRSIDELLEWMNDGIEKSRMEEFKKLTKEPLERKNKNDDRQ